MSWPRVVALALLVAGAVTAAAFHNDVIAATLAGAAAGFAVNREPNGNGTTGATPPPR
jgi:hypothetical protein